MYKRSVDWMAPASDNVKHDIIGELIGVPSSRCRVMGSNLYINLRTDDTWVEATSGEPEHASSTEYTVGKVKEASKKFKPASLIFDSVSKLESVSSVSHIAKVTESYLKWVRSNA